MRQRFLICAMAVPLLVGQTSNSTVTPKQNAEVFKQPMQFVEPPVPADPLELAVGDAEAVQNADQRAAAIKTVLRALNLSDMQAIPYERKISFVTFGSSSSDGSWQLDDASSGDSAYRWTAQGPNYSVTNLLKDSMLFSSQPVAAIPIRFAQVRGALFPVRPSGGSAFPIRIAATSLNGRALQCILFSSWPAVASSSRGRHWEEMEYCVDDVSGALVVYSVVPGIYALFDYSRAIRFHDRLIAGKFSISQTGQTIIEAKTVSVSDSAKEGSVTEQKGLSQVGVSQLIRLPLVAWQFGPSSAVPAGLAQVVVIHGTRAPSGEVKDLELIASSNRSFNSEALEQVAKTWSRWPQTEAGAAPILGEVILVMRFLGAAH